MYDKFLVIPLRNTTTTTTTILLSDVLTTLFRVTANHCEQQSLAKKVASRLTPSDTSHENNDGTETVTCEYASQKKLLPVFSEAVLGIASLHTSRASSKAVTRSLIARNSCLTTEFCVRKKHNPCSH